MRKSEAKEAFDELFDRWAAERGVVVPSEEIISFTEFRRWTEKNHCAHYFNFRSVAGAQEDVERWFDQRFKQAWRN